MLLGTKKYGIFFFFFHFEGGFPECHTSKAIKDMRVTIFVTDWIRSARAEHSKYEAASGLEFGFGKMNQFIMPIMARSLLTAGNL